MTTSKQGEPRGSGTAGFAGGAGPEQNLHLDHDSVRPSETPSRLEAAQGAVSDAASAVVDAASTAREQTVRFVGQARETVTDTYESARDRARDLYETGTERVDAYRSRGFDAAASGRQSAERFVAENPILVGVVGLAAGLLLGSLLPRTRQEDRVVGRWAGDARDQGMRYAREATERGRQFVDEAVGGMREGVRAAENDVRRETRVGPSGRYQNH